MSTRVKHKENLIFELFFKNISFFFLNIFDFQQLANKVSLRQEALRALWSATYPDQELHGLISEQWKEMGWQGRDPSTDFRLFCPSLLLHIIFLLSGIFPSILI